MWSLASLLQRYSRDRNGAVAIVFSVTLLAIVVALGISVDYGIWVKKRGHLSGASDIASLAGARELANAFIERDDDNAISRTERTAKQFALSNVGDGAQIAIQVATANPMSVTVTLSERGAQHFSKVIAQDAPTIRTISQATAVRVANACVVALSKTAMPGIAYNLSGQVVANGCSIWSNSATSSSTSGKGSGTVTSDTNCAVGTASVGGGLTLAPNVRSNCIPVLDPFAHWSPPPTPWSCKDSNLVLDKPGEYTLSPGKYCGGITVKGQAKVRFEPGTYFIKDGDLNVEGGGSISGTGVSFILTGGAAVDLGGAGVVDLSAPTFGSMAGMVFASGRSEPTTTSIIRGEGAFKLQGHVYLPTHDLTYAGGPSGLFPAAYTSVTASTVTFSGSSRIEFRNEGSVSDDKGARAFSHVHIVK